MRIEVDVPTCRSYALCVGIAPEYFELDDDGLITTLKADVDPADEEQVREAAMVCPTMAITLLESDA